MTSDLIQMNPRKWLKIQSFSKPLIINDLSIKLNRANALLFKMRKYVSLKILRSIYFAIFDSYLSYCCLVWAQNCSTIQRIIILQKKAIRIINLQPRNFHTSPLFKQNSILKFQDKICLENILFVSKSLNNLSPSVFNTWFIFSSDQHNYETSSSTQGKLIKLFYKTDRYGKYSIIVCCWVVEENPKTNKRYATWRSILQQNQNNCQYFLS